MAEESKQLSRQWAILRLLAASGRSYSVKELAEQLVVSKATVERDLATLEVEFGVVEQHVGKQKKVYRLDPALAAVPAISFGPSELLALYAAHASYGPLADTPLHEDLQGALHKIRGALAPRHNGALDAMSRVFAPHRRGHVDYRAHGELIDELADAIARRRGCVLEYHAAWKGTTRRHDARPLKIVAHQSSLYLLACLGEHTRITTLAVHRIRSLDVTAATFPPPRVDVEAHIAKAFGIFVSDAEEDVEIHFAAEIAWRVEERTFHPSEMKHRLPDGTLRYRLRSSAQWEVVPWVQSFGPQAELVAPVSWREALRNNATATLARYSSG